MHDIFADVWKQCHIDIPGRLKTEHDWHWWEAQGKFLRQEMGRRSDADAAWEVLTSITGEVVIETIRELHSEVG